MTDKEAELKKIRESIALFRNHEAELARQVGEPSVSTVASSLRVEDESALLFDRMTPTEKMDLWQNNREEWQRVIAAKEAAGFRQLLNKR